MNYILSQIKSFSFVEDVRTVLKYFAGMVKDSACYTNDFRMVI
ncbi:hypothetical protein SMSK597_0270 [Streptococcus mitis SK597]|uniref:Uncharacterized protein n=1 Tax=Streptococcus mitis SK597 TaxID=585204 RepID=E1LR65_STRMT|nr:hypothetical protein SMSK597_0270 [Streptococcus mitis SK597]